MRTHAVHLQFFVTWLFHLAASPREIRSSYTSTAGSSKRTFSAYSESNSLCFPWISSRPAVDSQDTIQSGLLSNHSDKSNRPFDSYPASSAFRRPSTQVSLISNNLNLTQSDRITSTQRSEMESNSYETEFDGPVPGEEHAADSPASDMSHLRAAEGTKASGRQMNFHWDRAGTALEVVVTCFSGCHHWQGSPWSEFLEVYCPRFQWTIEIKGISNSK